MDHADRITAAYHRVWERAAEWTGHPVERTGGLSLVSTGAPAAFLNRAFVQQDPDDPAAGLDNALRFFGDLPFLFEIRRNLHPRAAQEAAGRGLSIVSSSPGMVMSPVDLDGLSTGCEGLDIKAVTSDDDVRTNLAVQADAFGMPVDLLTHVFGPFMTADNVRAFTGWCQDKAVTTALVIADDGLAGIYSVATLPDARGRGFGEAMTGVAVRSGVEDLGCTESYLQASAMGKGIYERMGYRTVTTYDAYAASS